MRKRVSIIIPFKGQTETDLIIPLSSINNQIGVDLSQVDVHLVNDGGAPIDVHQFDVLSHLEIHYHELAENVGAGMARQYGIDHSDSDYLMFIDADDVLQYVGALWPFFNAAATQDEPDVIAGNIMEQILYNDGVFHYKIHKGRDRKQAVYAKWFKRDYLERIGIRFLPDLRIFEDTYFATLACVITDKIVYLNETVYSWLWNEHSLVRDPENKFRHQAHLWAQQNRYYFQMLRKWKPELVKPTLENYLANAFLKEHLYAPIDEAAFWEEEKKLISELSDYYQGWTPELQENVNQKSADENNEYHGIETGTFKAWLEKAEV